MKTNSDLFRRVKTVLLTLALALPLSGWAQFNYTINNGAVTITKYTGSGGNVVIPATISGFPVKSIGTNAFDTLNLPSSLTGVTIPNSVTNIGSYAFYYCYNVTNISIGTGVTTIGDGAFYNCTKLKSLTLPNSATDLGYSLFYYCSALTNVTLPTGLTRIPLGLFFDCQSLPGVAIPAGVTSIEGQAFQGCSSLLNVAIPDNVTNIGYQAFQFCQTMTNVIIPNSVTTIGEAAFNACYALPSVTIPASVTNLGNQVFWYSTSLTNILVNGLNPTYSSVDGVLFNKTATTLIQYPGGRAGGYAVPTSVTNIPEYGFYYCPYLASVTLPAGLTAIRDNTFWYAAALTNVIIPDSVSSIGYAAFTGCSSLTSVTIPGSVTNISQSAFAPCYPLQQVYFLGNAPTVDGVNGTNDNSVFNASQIGTVYYPPGATGWGATFGSWPTAVGTYQRQPRIINSGQGFGVNSNKFNFNISWAPNASVVVEASTNLVNWNAIATNLLATGTNAFADANWTNYSKRFYRVHSY
jgi:hypothetical protein